MEISKRLKEIIFKYLLKDLNKVEIIYYRDSVWFIDRENRYWYFEYHKVDKHLWWRWSHFTSTLTMFSMDAEKEQSILGELVNMILTKKQKLESKYPNKIFKTIGSVMNFEDKDEDVSKNEIKTTDGYGWKPRAVVDEVLNCEVETTSKMKAEQLWEVEKVLNYKVEKTEGVFYNDEIVTQEVLDFSVETTKSGELIEEDKIIGDVLEILSIRSTERGVNDMVDFVLEVEDYQAWNGKQETKVNEVLTQSPKLIEKQYDVDVVLDNTIEINSIEKLKGESPFQDIVVGHILNESDKVTDKLKMKEDDYVKTYSHDVYMCDHLVQNVLDVGVNSIHYDAEPHTQLVDGILKKA